MNTRRCVVCWIVLAAGMPAAAQSPDASDPAKEAALGKRLAADFRQHTTAIEDPAVQRYLKSLTRRLGAPLAAPGVAFTLSAVVDDPCSTTHEPATLPGGFVFVPAPLFLASQNEGEFAGMLAHAMAHLIARDGMQQIRETSWAAGSSIPLIFAGGFPGNCSAPLPVGAEPLRQRQELAADKRALQIMARAGFDASAFVRYIERVQAPAVSRDGYSLLPPREQRLDAMQVVIATLGPSAPLTGPLDEFARVQQPVRVTLAAAQPRRKPPSLLRKTGN